MPRDADLSAPAAVSTPLSLAADWFLHSGIREPNGGVARYYKAFEQTNAPVSTEISGYGASAFAYLGNLTGEKAYLQAARQTAAFLASRAWNAELGTFPFECAAGSPSYFFDCGIIVRGLLAVWRTAGDDRLLDIATQCGASMIRDFLTADAIHPVVELPSLKPLPYQKKKWSREPSCFQLKGALAWRDLHRATGRLDFLEAWEKAIEFARASDAAFLPGTTEREKIVDRLHAYCYFMEALLAEPSRPECVASLRAAIPRTARLVRELDSSFARSDVYAQLLRVRLYADALGIAPLDRDAAYEEAYELPSFQYDSPDPRLHGGYCFGRAHGELLPFANPVSTAFCMQAREMWRLYLAGEFRPELEQLI